MKAFDYVAADPRGELKAGVAWAVDERELDGRLEAQGLVLTRARVVADEGKKRSSKLGRDELVHFTNQLATVTGAGVPITEGLAGIRDRMESRTARRLIDEMLTGLRGGESLSSVMQSYPRAFPPVYLASVRAGEASGALERVLTRLAGHLEWARAMRATTLQALIYPAVLLFAVFGLIAILLYFLLPRILAMFPGGAAELPLETRIVMGASSFLTQNVLWILFAAAAAGAVLMAALRSEKGRLRLDALLLRVPKLGRILNQLATSKFACTAAILQSAGCDVFTVLDVSASTCGNAAMAASFQDVAGRVRQGAILSEALERAPWSDPLLLQMVSVGEKTGDLDRCLESLVRHYDDEIPRSVKRFLALLEPTLLLAAGGVVAFILLAALLPIFELYETMG